MQQRTLAGDPTVTLTLRRSARARRFSLRVSRLDGRITLSMPNWAREDEALAFAEGHSDWIRRTLDRGVQPTGMIFGATVPVQGVDLTLTPAPVRAPRIEGSALLAPADPARLGARVEAYLKLMARQRLQAATQHYATVLGRPFTRITLRDTRSRWGSCAPDGSLMYSWRLILAPPAVLDYVVAHEVAHLAEMNHSPAFWAVVARLMPDYQTHRRWLKRQGNLLHQYDFANPAPG